MNPMPLRAADVEDAHFAKCARQTSAKTVLALLCFIMCMEPGTDGAQTGVLVTNTRVPTLGIGTNGCSNSMFASNPARSYST